MNKILSSTVAIVVVDRHDWAVDGQLLEVGATVTVDLCVKIREDATLKQRVFCEIDTANDMSRLKLESVRACHNSHFKGTCN